MTTQGAEQVRIVIIGAGFAGLGMAVRLDPDRVAAFLLEGSRAR